MTTNAQGDVDIENNEEEVEEDVESTEDEDTDESTDDAQDEEIESLKKEVGILKRNLTKATKTKETPEPTKTEKSGDNEDYGELAYLTANGIKDEGEIALTRQVQKESGQSLREVIESDYFQHQLKGLRDNQETKDAVPKSKRRGVKAASDTVDYWVKKIEAGKATVTDVPDQALRYKIVAAREAQDSTESVFSQNPTGQIVIK